LNYSIGFQPFPRRSETILHLAFVVGRDEYVRQWLVGTVGWLMFSFPCLTGLMIDPMIDSYRFKKKQNQRPAVWEQIGYPDLVLAALLFLSPGILVLVLVFTLTISNRPGAGWISRPYRSPTM